MLDDTRTFVDVRFSRDGRKLALHISDQDDDIWVLDVTRRVLNRVTFVAGEDETPAWSPDGTELAFASTRQGDQARQIRIARAVPSRIRNAMSAVVRLRASMSINLPPSAPCPSSTLSIPKIGALALARRSARTRSAEYVAASASTSNVEGEEDDRAPDRPSGISDSKPQRTPTDTCRRQESSRKSRLGPWAQTVRHLAKSLPVLVASRHEDS